MWTRRDIARLGLASCLMAGAPRLALAAPRGPRYFVIIMLRGGVDAVYTADPKVRAEVDSRVDVPYEPSSIVETGGVPLGPHFEALKPWGERLGVLRGVQVRTANHESGAQQMLRLRTSVNTQMPALLDLIGMTRDSQPLASVTMGSLGAHEHSVAGFSAPTYGSDNTLLDRLDATAPADLELLARIYSGHQEQVERWAPSLQRDRTVEHLTQVRDLFDRLPSVAPFRPETWSESGRRKLLGADLQRVLWLLENDLTRGVYMKTGLGWDTHYRNASGQASGNRDFASAFAKFLEALHTRRNEHGTLAEQTVVLAASELGRFPVLNGVQGKDHFPETFFLLAGAAAKGVFGETGQLMEGLPVSLRTGRAESGGTRLVLDDVGSTMLRWAGLEPSVYGYRGRALRFLEPG